MLQLRGRKTSLKWGIKAEHELTKNEDANLSPDFTILIDWLSHSSLVNTLSRWIRSASQEHWAQARIHTSWDAKLSQSKQKDLLLLENNQCLCIGSHHTTMLLIIWIKQFFFSYKITPAEKIWVCLLFIISF